MNLRKLENKDAEKMLEWMHDPSVVKDLHTDFQSKKIEDCRNFIQYSQTTENDLHLAIVDDKDEYMGTVSLKSIDKKLSCAEFAITVRTCAMGKGFSSYGMKEILRKGHEELGLKNIYWCVADYNARAVRFYDKNEYTRVTEVPAAILKCYSGNLLKHLIWYCA